MFCLTAVRFTYTGYATFHSSAALTFAISTAVSYHSMSQMWKCVGRMASWFGWLVNGGMGGRHVADRIQLSLCAVLPAALSHWGL